MRFGYFALLEVPEWTTDEAVLSSTMDVLTYCDQAGFESVHIAEHHVGEYVCSAPQVLLSYLAAATKRVRLGMGVAVLPYIHPLIQAEHYATVDQLSGGRLEFGVGRGYQPIEFKALGIDLGESRDRMDEAVDIILRAWKGEPFAYEGKFFSFPEVSVHPLPVQRPHPPLLVASAGGYVPGAVDTFSWGAERNCRIVIGGFRPPDRLREDRAAQRRIALEHGHEPAAVEDALRHSAVVKHVYVADSEHQAIEECQRGIQWFYQFMGNRRMFGAPTEVQPWEFYEKSGAVIAGTPESVTEQLLAFQESSGEDYVWIRTDTGGVEREKVLRSLDLFASKVMPRLAHQAVAS